ncbi:polyprenyl synthetase family protein [Anaerocolumna cellulosilytica]|uniref:polyprenyl synthetase family protein n=1 Tax=Anaerocolumna cellulosilytica TaxID=433286 RepID=UPI0038CC0BD5
MDFNKELEDKTSYLETVIKKYLPRGEKKQKKIFEAMNYSILAGGKRLRPMFMLETYYLFGGKDAELIEPFLAAMEMIHTYSLVHDDLPAMDNDEYRRGRKTTHVVYGEAMGILAGDGLLNLAFETACLSFKRTAELEKTAKALSILAQKAGIYGMIGGQVIDMEGIIETDSDNLYKIEEMYHLKTGALMEASMMIGAILAGADEKEVSITKQMAADIGLAFQIQDDILDIVSTTEVLGKPVHSDEKNEKITYVTVVGMETAKQKVEELSKRGLEGFTVLKRNNLFFENLIQKLITREK